MRCSRCISLLGRWKSTSNSRSNNVHDLSIETLLDPSLKDVVPLPNAEQLIQRYRQSYSNQQYIDFLKDYKLVHLHRRVKHKQVDKPDAVAALYKLGIIPEPAHDRPSATETSKDSTTIEASKKAAARDLVRKFTTEAPSEQPSKNDPPVPPSGRTSNNFPKIAELDRAKLRTLDVSRLALTALKLEEAGNVPQLSFDLSRVLFNPGVYMLQDPRSRVYNFDPYLEHLMPVTDFNFDALNAYITSSQDEKLRRLAREHDKRYVGSSSSMSGILQHFHFLLSQWRPLSNMTLTQFFFDSISKGELDRGTTFTRINRAPSAIFLRYKDGVYAVDADKEFDSANILMHLGRSMEKLLTVDKEVFETYKKSGNADTLPQDPENYHYSEAGQFLLRSQLDAHDPRLPGTGMFDLKTRAVVSIRMNMTDYTRGTGYEIRGRFGSYRSYEREYFDMIRAAFLKYSLQVRMGRMDGIFVAYHNITRIFGFQYISLAELDLALHGQSNRRLGDLEFNASINLVNQIFNEATVKFPGKVPALPLSDIGAYLEATNYLNGNICRSCGPMKRFRRSKKITKPKSKLGTRRSLSQASPQKYRLQTQVTSQLRSPPMKLARTPRVKKIPRARMQRTKSFLMRHCLNPWLARIPRTWLAGSWSFGMLSTVNRLCDLLQWTKRRTGLLSIAWSPMEQSQVPSRYVLIKNKRQAALDSELKSNTSEFPYLKRLMQLSDEGRAWRKKQDEIDSQQERVTLYPETTINHT